eukprot:m.36808 g.36808  ORF g.36808 m.36808 type:complete len:89 (+) comp7614_c0_seq1:5822-6088(+)
MGDYELQSAMEQSTRSETSRLPRTTDVSVAPTHHSAGTPNDDLLQLFRVTGLNISPEVFTTVLELVRAGYSPESITRMITEVLIAGGE